MTIGAGRDREPTRCSERESHVSISRPIADQVRDRGHHPALVFVDGPTPTYGDLDKQIKFVADALAGPGASIDDTIGIAVRYGVEVTVTFLAVTAVSAAAPLNPTYQEPEFDFEIQHPGLAAIIVGTGSEEIVAATSASIHSGIPLISVSSTADGRLEMTVVSDEIRPVMSTETERRAEDDDVALVLHTSGITAQPKIMTLTHADLWASASAVGSALALERTDRCCNVMPLFHICGPVAGLISFLVSGATVIVTTGFSAANMHRWLVGHEATW